MPYSIQVYCSGFFTALLWVNILIKDLAAFYSNDIFVAYFTLTMYDNVLQESPGQERFGGRVSSGHCRDGAVRGEGARGGAALIDGSPAPYINLSIWRQHSVLSEVGLTPQGHCLTWSWSPQPSTSPWLGRKLEPGGCWETACHLQTPASTSSLLTLASTNPNGLLSRAVPTVSAHGLLGESSLDAIPSPWCSEV